MHKNSLARHTENYKTPLAFQQKFRLNTDAKLQKLGEPSPTNTKSAYTALQLLIQHYKKQTKPGADKPKFLKAFFSKNYQGRL